MSSESSFGKEHGLINEVLVTGRKVGADKKFWASLAHNKELFRKVVAVVINAITFTLKNTVDKDMAGWNCVEHASSTLSGPFVPRLFHPSPQFSKGRISAKAFVKLAKEKGVLAGLRHAEAMLREQHKIPQEWREYNLVFAEVWHDSQKDWDGIWFLEQLNGVWELYAYWIEDNALPPRCKLVGVYEEN